MGGNKLKYHRVVHTLNSSANICLFSGDGYTARPSSSSLFRPNDFFTNTVSPRPPSSVRTQREIWVVKKTKPKKKINHPLKYFTASSIFDLENALKILTWYCLSQNELHLLIGSVFGVFNQLVDSVSSGVKPRRFAHFGQGDLPPSLHHNCILWKYQAPRKLCHKLLSLLLCTLKNTSFYKSYL